MTKITAHGHRPACMNPENAVEQASADASNRQMGVKPNGSLETVQTVKLGFIKLKIHRPNTAEIALRAQLQKIDEKAVPHPSKNALPEGLVNVHLNGKVKVAPATSSTSFDCKAVACRHFALEFARESRKKSELTSTLTQIGIRHRFDGTLAEKDAAFHGAIRNAPQGSKHVVCSDQLGSYLTALATTLKTAPKGQDRPKEANCLLLTANHAMALHVEHKSKAGVDYFSAKLYDPEDTANYKRVVKSSPEGLSSLEMKDMLIRPELISGYAGAENTPLSMVAVCLDHRLQLPVDRGVTAPSSANMQVALRYGASDAVDAMLQSAATDSTPQELVALLHATSPANPIPGLLMALGDGHTQAVRTFSEFVLNSKDLQVEEKVFLLQAKRSDGQQGLFGAIEMNHAETVSTFVKSVTQSDLSEANKIGLLIARCPDTADFPESFRGSSALAAGRERGRDDAVAAFCGAVEEAFSTGNLSMVARDKLLRA